MVNVFVYELQQFCQCVLSLFYVRNIYQVNHSLVFGLLFK